MKKLVLPVVLLAIAIAIAAAFIVTRQPLMPRAPESPPLSVRVVEAAPAPVRLSVHAQGTVAPRTESELVPEVSGNVVWISPSLVSGGYFSAGDPLLRIDPRDYETAVSRAAATLERARADDELAQFELERAEELFARSLISQADRESKERAARVSRAALADAELVLETARRDLTRTELRAPFSGLVRSEQVDVGQFVSRGSAVARVYATDYLEVRLPIADQELAYLNVPLNHRGAFAPEDAPAVRLSADFAGESQLWEASLVRTEAEIDPNTRMVYAIARVDTEAIRARGAIPPPVGLFVEAEIDGSELDDIVVLPRSALRSGEYVLVIDSENRVRLRQVEVLRVYRDEAYLSAGLERGERVVVSMLQTVVEGMRVQPVLAGG